MISKIAINACGLHTGGGIQVAVSFIHELSNMVVFDLNIDVFVSTEVADNIKEIDPNIFNKFNFKVYDVYGFGAFYSKLNMMLNDYDLVFTIFGPNYLRSPRGLQVVGFAQAWIVDNSAYNILSLKEKFIYKAKFFLQSIFFRRADKLIVELEHVRKSLVKSKIAAFDKIEVVKNCISSLYFNPHLWHDLDCRFTKTKFTIGYLGRDYSHKNTDIIPFVKDILLMKHGLDVDFLVTFNEFEWLSKSKIFVDSVINVGSLSVSQCPRFYEAVDAIFFPSLLECFSATPLEAMAMRKPLFASDRHFVRDICGDFAFYFDPYNPESAADSIANYFFHTCFDEAVFLQEAHQHVLNFSNARQRAEGYLSAIRKTLAD